ncbi:MAG TPA: 16S rRNA (guanine(966)-N(2))-methyltransferase RsmD [Mycobacteriales bacterium]|nr:16S rRNA (guanine(966)-N(2))-methyltransferase RsmD [Mycobacteriales bacterium]
MTRVIGGVAGGRRLRVPPGVRTRPTSDRAREGLFSTLESLLGTLDGIRFADLYAGSGAVGLEALSRGAVHALLVESDVRAAAVLHDNVRSLGVTGAQVRQESVARVIAEPPPAAYDVVFLDPPYADPVDAVLAAVATNGWLRPGGVLAVERASRDPEPAWPAGVEGLRSRRYGEGTLWYGRRS